MVTARPTSNSVAEINVVPPVDDGGSPITKYKIEIDEAEAGGKLHGASDSMLFSRHEVQSISV